jgi:hypothetical protein
LGFGFREWGLGLRVWGVGFGVEDFRVRVSGVGFRVWELGFWVWGLGFRVKWHGTAVVEARQTLQQHWTDSRRSRVCS